MSNIIPQYDLDWSTGRVYAKDIPRDIVVKKFLLLEGLVERISNQEGMATYMRENKLWDELTELLDYTLGDIDSLPQHFKDEAVYLLSDDTIYAYAMLRWEGMPIMLRYFQDAIVSDTHKRIDVEASNQSGKSFSLCVKASVKFHRNHNKNTTIGLVSKSMQQNGMNMRMITKMLKEASAKYDAGSNDNMTVRIHEVTKTISNNLVCAVASTSALGFPFDWLLLDEFEFWDNPEGLDYMWDQVLEPRTFNTKGQIVIYSNPNGKNFVSENLHKRTVGKEHQFHVYNVNFLDVTGNTQEEWDTKKEHTHPIMFASTMAAIRTETEGAALTDRDIKKTVDEELDSLGFRGCVDKDSYFALDLGFVHDQSCLAGCYLTKNHKDETVYNFAIKVYPRAYEHEYLWGRKDGSEDSIPQVIKKYGNKFQRFELDLTGKEGNEILANEAGLSCMGIKMTGPWKATWYERFITLVKQGRVKIQTVNNWVDNQNKNFDYQARSLQISTKMPDGRSRQYPLYHHSKETDHDDILDAVVLCLSLIDEDMVSTPSVEFIDGSKPESEEEDMYATAARLNKEKSYSLFYGGF